MLNDHAGRLQPRSARTEIPALAGIRAVACLTVFLENFHHSIGMTVSGRFGPFDATYFAESGIGVALLIVLSGCLISLPLWRQLDDAAGAVPWMGFVVRRATRLVPAYYACLVAFAVVSSDRDWFDYALHFLFINNLRERSFYSISPEFWTIGVFVQLYFVVPFVFLGLRRTRARGASAFAVVVGAAFAMYLLHVAIMRTRQDWLTWPVTVWVRPDGYVLSHSVIAHLPLFLFGVAAGWFLSRVAVGRPLSSRAVWIAETVFWTAAAGLLVLCSAPAANGLQLPFARYLFPWVPALAAVLVAAAPVAPMGRRLLDVAPLRGLGAISYGFYIYQVACLLLLQRVLSGMSFTSPGGKAMFFVAGCALTIVVAAVSYVAFERPLLQWGRRGTGDRSTPRSAGAVS